ncbi:hypothetical protein NLJ89_g11150 [Agrocybe chaxingu]|uniref:Protein CPL1-like domain-containing protein n=1 Tax=Agrocybe chaxingu TaxID=84603 RepID=A0A9W8JQI1_9AGAR|nr:hypothetical protein NLJ89_g11150 [Agrocybe chaxingu]
MHLPISTLFLSSLSLLTLFPTPCRFSFPAVPLSPRLPAWIGLAASGLSSTPRDVLANATQLLGLESLLGPLNINPDIQLCLCLKDLDIYLDTNADIQAVVGLLGKDPVRALITALINTSPDAHQCTFPQHAHHTCNNNDACHWDCDEGYIREGNTCVCAPPYTSCNGVCGLFRHGCPSSVPRTLQPRAAIVTFAQAKATCGGHTEVCGVSGRENSMAFECVDTETTRDSCGGCMVPHPFFESEPVRRSTGQDCSAIPNAKSVGCSESRCVVHTCNDGWIPATTLDQCIRDPAQSTPTKIVRVLKRSMHTAPPSATATSNVNPDLVSQLLIVVEQVLSLNAACPSSLPSTQPATPGLPSTSDLVPALLNDVYRATGNLVTSSTVASLLASVSSLLDTSSLLGSTLGSCGCADDLGLTNLEQELNVLIRVLLDLQDFCGHNPVVTGPGSSNGSNTVSSSGAYSSAHPVTSVVSHAPPAASSPSSCSVCSTSSTADGSALIVGLSDLLGGLLGPHSGVIVAGLLGNSLDNSLNNLLNSLSLGPNNFRRRQLTTNANATAAANSSLITELDTLVDLVLDLNSESASLPSVGSGSSIIDSGLVDSVVNASITLISAQTYVQLVYGVDQLVGASLASLHAFDQCGCQSEHGLQATYRDIVKIVHVALTLQQYTETHPASSSSGVSGAPNGLFSNAGAGVPLVVGLTKLLNGLGISGSGGAVVSGLLGDGLDNTLNSLLDSLNLGPHGLRR